MARVVLNLGFMAEIHAAESLFLDAKLGPLIEADAKRYAPKRTGQMATLIFHEVRDQTLYIISPAPYSAYVELGHRVFHPHTGITGPDVVVAEPFLRPALYKYRTPALVDPPALFPVAIPHYSSFRSFTSLLQYEEFELHWKYGG